MVDEDHVRTLEIASDLARVCAELLDDLLVPIGASSVRNSCPIQTLTPDREAAH
jgi:hypothetical protein